MMSAYSETTRSVSARDSSFAAEEFAAGLDSEITVPPRRSIAVSVEKRVLVEGWKNIVQSTLPFIRFSWSLLYGSISSAARNRCSSSSSVRLLR